MSIAHWLARIEVAESRALAAEAERDRYREALMSISRYPNCPRGIYSILLDSLEGDHEEPVLFSFDGWYKEGVRLGYCSVQFCSTHDGAPMHESEERAWGEGHDPCCHVVRLLSNR